jgi:hypothetical protein
MVDLIFKRGTEVVGINVNNKHLTFAKMQGGFFAYAPIEGLELSAGGILKDNPDLKDLTPKEIKQKGTERFKQHIKSLPNEKAIIKYLKEDLEKHGYTLDIIKKKGFRPTKIK